MLPFQVAHGERFNTSSHFYAIFIALCGVLALMYSAISKQDGMKILTCTVYGFSTVGIYVISTLYHAAEGPKKNLYRTLDYVWIYLKIAGNYTPYAILAIGGFHGYAVLASVWVLALTGIAQEVALRSAKRWLSNIIYLAMAASVAPVLKELYHAVPLTGFGLIMLGFLSYAIGFVVFLNDEKIPHGHGIWHLLVMGGSTSQFLCLWLYVI